MRIKFLSAILAVCLTVQPANCADTVTGRASVIDGDTLEITGHKIRLNGIDAPESWQECWDEKGEKYRCGKVAAAALDEWLVKSRPINCIEINRDRYRRIVADCTRADGASVNAWLVEQGHAVDWVRYSKGRYASEEDRAEAAGRGIWRGSFELPCEARALKSGRKVSC